MTVPAHAPVRPRGFELSLRNRVNRLAGPETFAEMGAQAIETITSIP